MTQDEICGLLRQIHDVLAMQSETNFVPQQPTPASDGYHGCTYICRGQAVTFEADDKDIEVKSWVGLTDEEIEATAKWADKNAAPWHIEFARAIEAKLKEKNV